MLLLRRLYHNPITRIPRAAPDRILGLTEEFNKDLNPSKVNLTVGIYKDNQGQVSTLPSVARAQQILENHKQLNTDLSYLPITGSAEYQSNVLNFLFRDSCPQGEPYLSHDKISFVQTLSGTGALAVASKLLSLFVSKTVWIPAPSWANHTNVFQSNGFKDIRYYTYYNNGTLDVDSWLQDLRSATKKYRAPQCIVLHACCHNPTGVDPTIEQWSKILDAIHDSNMIPILDMAYQGLESGDLYRDAYLLRMCLDSSRYHWSNGLYLCQSFAKNMGLYGERVGSLSVVVPSSVTHGLKLNIDSQLKKIVRGIYSSPPGYGSRVANLVLSDQKLRDQWFGDVRNMSQRLWHVRSEMFKKLPQWSNLVDRTQQHGMFYFTGLSSHQVDLLRKEHSVYLTQDGRLSLSGINDTNLDYVCEALVKVNKP